MNEKDMEAAENIVAGRVPGLTPKNAIAGFLAAMRRQEEQHRSTMSKIRHDLNQICIRHIRPEHKETGCYKLFECASVIAVEIMDYFDGKYDNELAKRNMIVTLGKKEDAAESSEIIDFIKRPEIKLPSGPFSENTPTQFRVKKPSSAGDPESQSRVGLNGGKRLLPPKGEGADETKNSAPYGPQRMGTGSTPDKSLPPETEEDRMFAEMEHIHRETHGPDPEEDSILAQARFNNKLDQFVDHIENFMDRLEKAGVELVDVLNKDKEEKERQMREKEEFLKEVHERQKVNCCKHNSYNHECCVVDPEGHRGNCKYYRSLQDVKKEILMDPNKLTKCPFCNVPLEVDDIVCHGPAGSTWEVHCPKCKREFESISDKTGTRLVIKQDTDKEEYDLSRLPKDIRDAT